jgi:hypothetical protein
VVFCLGLLVNELEMALSDFLDVGVLFARGAEPDMDIGVLNTDLLGEVGHLHASITGRLERGEDLVFQSAAGSTLALGSSFGGLCGTTGFLLGRASCLLLCGTATALAGRGTTCRLSGQQGGELGLDLFDLGKEALLALCQFNKTLKGIGVNV